jgi:hypothetical protein
MLYTRWAKWPGLMALDKAWLDYSNDGVMLPPGAEQYGDGVWHYTHALALASAAAHEDDGEDGWQQFGWAVLCGCMLLYYCCVGAGGLCIMYWWAAGASAGQQPGWAVLLWAACCCMLLHS